MAGKLYVVATPIGNLGDFSPRAVETLNSVDFIAAEDTRVGARLLSHFGIGKPQVSYFEHNRKAKGDYIADRIEAGENCAIITDAGTPAISDPGTDLVALCAARGIQVVGVPGCSAVVTALSVSGMDTGRFTFEGFLATNNKNRREHLEEVRNEKRTMVFYEAPHKLLRTLEDMLAAWGDRPIALCRELTKMYEEVRRTTLAEAVEYYRENAPRGEFVLVIGGCTAPAQPEDPVDLLAEVGQRIEDGMSLMSAVKEVSRLHNSPKNALYRQALERFGNE